MYVNCALLIHLASIVVALSGRLTLAFVPWRKKGGRGSTFVFALAVAVEGSWRSSTLVGWPLQVGGLRVKFGKANELPRDAEREEIGR